MVREGKKTKKEIFKNSIRKRKKKETERKNRRFAERAQTDHGVNAVLTWAKEEEGNLGPEVITWSDLKQSSHFKDYRYPWNSTTSQDLFISMNFEQFPGSFHIWWCWWDSLQTSSTSAEMVRSQAGCHHRWQKIHIRKFLSGCNLYFIHTISMSPPLSKNIYVHIPCQHITDCKNISSQRISCHHFYKRRPLDATRQPGKGASNRLSCSRKTSHLQPANHL